MNGLGAEKIKQESIKRHLPLFFLLLAVGIFHVFTMPKFFYPGDNQVSRAECANLINTGKLGIDYSQKKIVAAFLTQRGQFFYENDARQELYSKYGIGYTLLYIVPLWAEKLYSGKLDLYYSAPSHLVFTNIYNVIFTLLSTVYFYLIVSVYTSKLWRRIGFILLSYYTTFLWYYLRSPTTEVFQLLPFLGFYYHMAGFLRESRLGLGKDRKIWKHMFIAVCFAGILLSMKLFFALLFIIIGVLATMVPGWTGFRHVVKGAFRNLSEYRYQYLMYVILPSFVIVAPVLAVNHYKYGSIFETGYGQWHPGEGKTHEANRFALNLHGEVMTDERGNTGKTHEADTFGMNLLVPLHGFFLAKGNTNAFVHYPLFIFALFGMRRFAKKFPVDLCLILFLFGFITFALASFSGWTGGWCYGPRHLLFVLVIGSLPFLEVMDRIVSFKRLMKWCAIGVVTCVLGWSLLMQVYMNSLTYFSFYLLHAPLEQFKQERVDAYFNNCFHRGLINRDLIRYVKKGKPWFPLEVVKSVLSPLHRDRFIEATQRNRMAGIAEPNYFFCKTKENVEK